MDLVNDKCFQEAERKADGEWMAWNRETSCPTMSGCSEPEARGCSGILEKSDEKEASPTGLGTRLPKGGTL